MTETFDVTRYVINYAFVTS